VTGAFDWLNTSPDDFVRQYAPAAASRQPAARGTPRHRTPAPAPAPQAIQPVAQIGPSSHSGAAPVAAKPYQPHFHNITESQLNMFDLAKVQLNRLEMEALMKTDGSTPVLFNGKQMLLQDALTARMRGEGGAVVEAAPPTGPVQPSHQAGPGGPALRISQAAADALPQAQYEELERTGHIQGLTRSDNGRAVVHVRNSSGTVQSRFSFNPETGAVEPGRPMDTRMFHDPSAGDSK
jgi:hypothetical protein